MSAIDYQRHSSAIAARERLQDDLDLVRSLVRSWGDLVEGSVEQATAIRNSTQTVLGLLRSADVVASGGQS
jgi:hypothetical protein